MEEGVDRFAGVSLKKSCRQTLREGAFGGAVGMGATLVADSNCIFWWFCHPPITRRVKLRGAFRSAAPEGVALVA